MPFGNTPPPASLIPSGAPPLNSGSAVCHAACSSSSFLTAAPVSFTPLRSLLPSFRFISPRSQPRLLLHCLASCIKTQSLPQQDAQSLSQASATILTGFHYASLRHSFTSAAFSPPAAHFLLCSPAAPLRLRSPCDCYLLIRPSFRKASLRFTCIVRHLRALREIYCGAFLCSCHRPGRPGLSCQPLCGGSPSASVRRTSSLLQP